MEHFVYQTQAGFYCEPGDFYIDPWRAVPRAVVTHAHSDHLRGGCGAYLITRESEHIARVRLGHDAVIQTAAYGETVNLNGVRVSFHPAGHILGSAQVRIEYQGEVWVISGDYKRVPDPTCAPFEVVPCHTFITEATFGLPIYRWQTGIFEDINAWWRENQAAGKASLIFAYALGKAQRIIAGVDSSIGPIYTHGAVEQMNRAYRETGIKLPATTNVMAAGKVDWSGALIIAPPSARATPWTRRFGSHTSAYASGWMRIRGTRRRQAVDRGFALSDHADWPALLDTIKATGAERIGVTHGYVPVLVRWLREHGYHTEGYATHYAGEQGEELS